MLRFQLTDELKFVDWSDNSTWFDLKLLVEPGSGVYTVPMSHSTYSKAIKEVLGALHIPRLHLVHLGRILGAKILELKEEEFSKIHRLGNWNPT